MYIIDFIAHVINNSEFMTFEQLSISFLTTRQNTDFSHQTMLDIKGQIPNCSQYFGTLKRFTAHWCYVRQCFDCAAWLQLPQTRRPMTIN